MFVNGAEHDEYFLGYDMKTRGDFVLKPLDTSARRPRSERAEQPKAVIGSFYIIPEILEWICSFASQAALRQSICIVCISWYYASVPFLRRKGTWYLGPQALEDTLLSRMVTLHTLQFNFIHLLVGSKFRQAPYNRIVPAFGRCLKAITDPIEDVHLALSLLHH